MMPVTTILSVLLFAIIFFTALMPLRLRARWKFLLCVPVLLAAFKFQIFHLFGGPMFFAPELPAWLLLAGAWSFSIVCLLALFLLPVAVLGGISRLCFRFWKKEPPLFWRRTLLFLNASCVFFAILFASIGIAAGTAVPQIREQTLFLENLPLPASEPDANPADTEKALADEFRIVVLADLHADHFTRADRIRKIVELANAQNPDLLLIVGDFVDGSVEQCGEELRPLADLKARYGVYAVAGNHEYYSGYRPWMDFLSNLGIRMLLNESQRLPNGILLAGVTDSNAARFGEDAPDLKRASAKLFELERTTSELPLAILMAHQPKIAREAAKHRFTLQISGHTHGGMSWGLERMVRAANGGFVSGLYQVDGMNLYVSNGSGIWNGFPLRLGRPSEITVLRLRRP